MLPSNALGLAASRTWVPLSEVPTAYPCTYAVITAIGTAEAAEPNWWVLVRAEAHGHKG